MLNSYYTEKLLGLQEVSIKKVNDTKENYEIFIEQPRKQCVCPVCGKRFESRIRRILPLFCPAAGKTDAGQKTAHFRYRRDFA